jgi:DNA recombination protein RmuC
MNSVLVLAALMVGVLNAALLIILLRRRPMLDVTLLQPEFELLAKEGRRVEQAMREEFGRNREEGNRAGVNLREEVVNRIGSGHEVLLNRHAEAQRGFEEKLLGFRTVMETQLRQFGESSDTRLTRLRQELNETVAQQLERIRQTTDQKLTELQSKNEQKLDEMRRTVDEKLEGTLQKRLGDSFRLVSERLEAVHKGLGEMQVMASSVGDLKRVLTNVKARGTWGEIQLGTLLEQVLTPEQYAANVAPKPGSLERVEFAIRLPGRSEMESPFWLPIDAKFPQEDYQRLVEAGERGDAEGASQAGKALELRLRKQAKDISDKYIAPPYTTDFALLFLPSESLYAEVLRRPGLVASLQLEYRVSIAGPTTLGALLNSLQMGFRTLAIQQRSSEVWTVLSTIKGEFGKFGEVLSKVKAKLEAASKEIEQTEVRTRAINRQLREVQELPAADVARLLPEPTEVAEVPEELPDEEEDGILPFARPAKLGK